MLAQADCIIGHNIIGYDIPAIKKLYPKWKTKATLIDTIVIAKVAYPDIKSSDYGRFRAGKLPGQLIGKHKFEAWGYRLGEFKGGSTASKMSRSPSFTRINMVLTLEL